MVYWEWFGWNVFGLPCSSLQGFSKGWVLLRKNCSPDKWEASDIFSLLVSKVRDHKEGMF